MWRSLLVLLVLSPVALAGLAGQKLAPKPDKYKDIEGCYIEEIDQMVPFGQSVPCPNHCMEYRCTPAHVVIVTCSVGIASPPCTLVEDHSKPYPGCCPTIECPKH